jgi:LysM repeat protein
MALKLGAVALAVVLVAIAFQGLISGGGGDNPVSLSRPASIPTATFPATLSAPILLSEANPAPGRPTSGSATGGAGSYVVKPGDTLSGIASQMNVPSDQQAAWTAEVLRLNGIADVRLLAVGQELNLPRAATPPAAAARTTGTPQPGPSAPPARTSTPASPTSASATAPPSTPAPSAPTATPRPPSNVTGGGGSYTVAAGDFPLLIAAKLGVPDAQQGVWAEQLMSLNGLCSSCLQVGQTLQLPAGTPGGGATAPAVAPTPRP